MEEKDLYWLAGLLEGEGTFSKNVKMDRTYIRLEMCDEDVVKKAAGLFGNTYNKIKPRKIGYKPSYVTQIISGRAIELMRLLLPLMGARRQERIKSLINTYIEKDSRLTKEQHDELITLCESKQITQKEIAKQFGISRESVNKIYSKYRKSMVYVA